MELNYIWNEEVTAAAENKPVVAAAIHDGHILRAEVAALTALSDAERLREEDPYTGRWTAVAGTRVVGLVSRFEVDLNRPRDKAVYRVPADAWGLNVWKSELPEDIYQRSLAEYDNFYEGMSKLLTALTIRYGRLVILDLHSYNHRRNGPDGPPADEAANPQVNIGTGTLNRELFGSVVDRFMKDLRGYDFPGGKLDVRENVKFQGGYFSRWVHEKFPASVGVIAVEFKKFFMDEWSGEPEMTAIDAIEQALASTVPGITEELQ